MAVRQVVARPESSLHRVLPADTLRHENAAVAERLYVAGRRRIFTLSGGAACCKSGYAAADAAVTAQVTIAATTARRMKRGAGWVALRKRLGSTKPPGRGI